MPAKIGNGFSQSTREGSVVRPIIHSGFHCKNEITSWNSFVLVRFTQPPGGCFDRGERDPVISGVGHQAQQEAAPLRDDPNAVGYGEKLCIQAIKSYLPLRILRP
jgi:hypothetical protein